MEINQFYINGNFVDPIGQEKIDLINQAEHLIYETEKNMTENGDKFDEKEKSELTEKLEKLKKSKDNFLILF